MTSASVACLRRDLRCPIVTCYSSLRKRLHSLHLGFKQSSEVRYEQRASRRVPPRVRVATASYQIEGAPHAERRDAVDLGRLGPTLPSAIDDSSDGCRRLRVVPRSRTGRRPGPGRPRRAGRLATPWPGRRIMPDGGAEVCRQGLQLLPGSCWSTDCTNVEITPIATLAHWDLARVPRGPRAAGCCARPRSDCADYAEHRPYTTNSVTRCACGSNPRQGAVVLSFSRLHLGRHAPGKQVGGEGAAARLTTCSSAAASRPRAAARRRPGAALGMVLACRVRRCSPRSSPRCRPSPPTESTRSATACGSHPSSTAPLVSRAPSASLPVLEDPDLVSPSDLDLVRGSADWLGVNYCSPAPVAEGTGDEARAPTREAAADVAAFPGVPLDFRFAPRHPRAPTSTGSRRRQPGAAAGRRPQTPPGSH